MADTANFTPQHQTTLPALSHDTANLIPSSSPGFGTPAFPIVPRKTAQEQTANSHKLNFQTTRPAPAILPVLLPAQTLRPLAFRTFTKKHNLTLTSSALTQLASFIGQHCGSAWREEGLAEKVLEEIAKIWKRNGGGILLEDGKDKVLTKLLRSLEELMIGGRLVETRKQSHLSETQSGISTGTRLQPGQVSRTDSQTSLGFSALGVSDSDDGDLSENEDVDKRWIDTRSHVRLIPAFSQPRLLYNVSKKFFELQTSPPTLFPSPTQKSAVFRARYNIIHQRLMRIESFQTPTFAASTRGRLPALQRSGSSILTVQQAYKITPVANLLGRSGTQHLLLGLLGAAATGELAITDLTGSILLDISEASLQPVDAVWACPGMIVLVEGVYDEDGGSNRTGAGGVGGTIGGRFIAITVTGPPAEKRNVTLGIKSKDTDSMDVVNAGFGWVDFLGVGSEKSVGDQMRRTERKILKVPTHEPAHASAGRTKVVFLGEVLLDNPKVLEALRKVLASYASSPLEDSPFSFVLMGNFVSSPAIGEGACGSIEYKEHFDALASILAEFPSLISKSTFVFVPGDNDPWPSAFGAGAAIPIPRESVPDVFTSRIRRTFAAANTESGTIEGGGEALWASNPARLSLFGPVHEIVLFRDDASGRFRRNSITFKAGLHQDERPGDVSTHQDEEQPEQNEADIEPVRMEIDAEIAAATSHKPEAQASKTSANSSTAPLARKLVKTIIDQAHLSPFPLSIRPVHWDYASSLHLYPLPNTLVLADAEAAPFAVSYEGCHVMNPGCMIDEAGNSGGRKGVVRWIEYDARIKKGLVKELRF